MNLLYTFRRCPYAIRARMTLAYSQIKVQYYEVDLKNKPEELLQASAKGTVPVLVLENGDVIDESIDIMRWSLKQSDLDGWVNAKLIDQCEDLIKTNDFKFKPILDRYKYPQSSENKDPVYYRDQALVYLEQLNNLLTQNRYLLADQISYADVALFPFIRQFCMVDVGWFEQSGFKQLIAWLHAFLDSELFLSVMKKP